MSQTPDTEAADDSPFESPPSKRRLLGHTMLLPVYLLIILSYYCARGSARVVGYAL